MYLDDIKVFSITVNDAMMHVGHVLTLLDNAGLVIKLEKVIFFAKWSDYFGYVICPKRLGNI